MCWVCFCDVVGMPLCVCLERLLLPGRFSGMCLVGCWYGFGWCLVCSGFAFGMVLGMLFDLCLFLVVLICVCFWYVCLYVLYVLLCFGCVWYVPYVS